MAKPPLLDGGDGGGRRKEVEAGELGKQANCDVGKTSATEQGKGVRLKEKEVEAGVVRRRSGRIMHGDRSQTLKTDLRASTCAGKKRQALIFQRNLMI